MNSLKGILNIFSSNEKVAFVSYLKKKNRRNDTKNIALFKLIESGNKNEIFSTLYKNNDRRAYHALRKRLYNSLIDFIAEKSFESDSSEEMDVLKLLLASKFFFKHQQHEIAFKTIKKAEKKANELELYSILNEIYQTQIQYAHIIGSNEIEHIIIQFKNNRESLIQQEHLNMGYALLRDELNRIHHNRKVIDFQDLINKTIAQLNISFEKTISFKSLYQIMHIANQYATINKEFESIERFMIKNYTYISNKKTIKKHLYYHIFILYFMTNMHFRNKNFDDANIFLKKMHLQMLEQKGKFFKIFILKYTLLQSLIDNYIGKNEIAIQCVETILNKKHKHDTTEIIDLQISLSTYYFQQENYKKCLSIFKKLIHTNNWYEKKMGIEWVIKKNIIEILLHIELTNIDYALSRLASFKKQYLNHLKKSEDQNSIIFLSFIEKYINYPEKFNSIEFQQEIESSFNWKLSKQEDIFRISFYAWLKSKALKTGLYETTLTLVNMN